MFTTVHPLFTEFRDVLLSITLTTKKGDKSPGEESSGRKEIRMIKNIITIEVIAKGVMT